MENIKKFLILLIVLTILIIITIILLSSKTDPNLNTDETEYTPKVIVNENLEKVSIRNNYYTVKNIVEKYYSSLCNLNKTSQENYDGEEQSLEELQQEDEINKNKIYSFFDNNYIEETGLSTNNLQEKLGNYKDLYVLIDNMYVRDLTESLKLYFVSGKLTEKKNLKTEEFGLMVLVDSQNCTFNIYTYEYVKKHNFYELSKTQDFKEKYFNIENIENKKYNKYTFKIINDETYARDLIKNYRESIKYNNIDYSYNRLHENYKTGRFQQKSEYEVYIQKNKKQILISNLQYYNVKKVDGYKQYICVDGKENYYIFTEKSIMDYTLILDTYTVDLPEFIEEYKSATDKNKVGMNIEKFISAVNQGDYKYIYSKLDNTFKQNKFPTEKDLQKYIENNFLEKNEIQYLKFSQEGDICIYKTRINEKNFNIIMKLGEGTEFTMSFSFE